jgi:hypothetical protein
MRVYCNLEYYRITKLNWKNKEGMRVYCNLEYYRITKLNWKNKEGVLADWKIS